MLSAIYFRSASRRGTIPRFCMISNRIPTRSRPTSASISRNSPRKVLRHSSFRTSSRTSSALAADSTQPLVPEAHLNRAWTASSNMQKFQHLTGSPAPASQIRMHSGHSHGHGHGHHHHDNTYLVSKNKNDAGVKVTRLGLFVNLGMTISKGVGGYVFNSQALIADAFHALTDLVSDFMTLATLSVALKPPTPQYPNGFGKVESFGSLVVSGLLLTGGILMATHSGSSLLHLFFGDSLHILGHAHDATGHSHGLLGHSHSAKDMIPNLNAAWLAGGSIVIKEYLYRITMKVAKERKSAVLASNAVHHRVDSLTSIVALVAIGGSHILEGATWLDPVGGLLVALMVIRAGYGNTMASVHELFDASIDGEIRGAVARAVGKALQSKLFELRHVEGIKAGQNYLLDIELAVPPDCPMDTMREIEERVRDKVANSVRGARRIRIRFVPRNKSIGDFSDEFIDGTFSPQGSPEPEDRNENHTEHSHASSVDAHSSVEKRR